MQHANRRPSRSRSRSPLALLASLVAGLLAAAPALAAESGFERSLPLAEGGLLVVELERGAVRVRPQPPERGNEARVEARWSGFGAAGVRFRFERDAAPDAGETLRLAGSLDPWVKVVRGGPAIEVEIFVPAGRSLRVATADGAVDVAGLRGDVSAASALGPVRIANVAGDVRVRAEDGRVGIEGVRGAVEVESGGAIQVFEAQGPVRAHAHRGAIQLDRVSGAVVARTEDGPVWMRLAAAPRGSVETQGGGIHVSLPAEAGGRLDARSAGGQVHVAPGLALAGERETHRVRGILGGGGGLLRLRALGGHILIR